MTGAVNYELLCFFADQTLTRRRESGQIPIRLFVFHTSSRAPNEVGVSLVRETTVCAAAELEGPSPAPEGKAKGDQVWRTITALAELIMRGWKWALLHITSCLSAD